MNHFRRTIHLALYSHYPICKSILWNIGNLDDIEDYFNRNSRNNMLFKVRLKFRGKHKSYMHDEKSRKRVNF